MSIYTNGVLEAVNTNMTDWHQWFERHLFLHRAFPVSDMILI